MQLNQYKNIVILGMGKTGFSCAKFLVQQHIDFVINDSREQPPMLSDLLAIQKAEHIYTGGFKRELILNADLIILSQGISLQTALLIEARKNNIKMINEVDLFTTYATAPIIAITGSNAKSTVTTLVGHILKHAGLKVLVGGNIGIPLLELLAQPEPDYYVLELSNFQLELTHNLNAKIACVLNLSPDHLDRYENYAAYVAAKKRIYCEAEIAVYNLDDKLTYPEYPCRTQTFSLTQNTMGFHLLETKSGIYLAKDKEVYILATILKLKGKHNWENALSASAIAYEVGISLKIIGQALINFTGLFHRCQWVATHRGIEWFNDSKGTNIGATHAAILGLGSCCQGKLILILGGQSKGADFQPLISPIKKYVKQVIILGEDALKINNTLKSHTIITLVSDLEEAVSFALKLSEAGDIVLFSPACASFDMFNNFEHRGQVYMDRVKELIAHDCCSDV
ncbi:MAG: UDP-N-acetylmuramoyl-L-alanine--D-glutamate ligase [Legionellales bacterium]|nr:UDP-N-acetylmuramoyl-L-alanine--D-glutamate ligase [Legionellales bacterium]